MLKINLTGLAELVRALKIKPSDCHLTDSKVESSNPGVFIFDREKTNLKKYA